jgi:spoIIIJ-associated protein
VADGGPAAADKPADFDLRNTATTADAAPERAHPAESVADESTTVSASPAVQMAPSSPLPEISPEAEPVGELTDDDARLAAELTQAVLDRMRFRTTCAGRLIQPADDKEGVYIWVAIEGEDASRLLAHQAESLEALQLVVQNMWAHKTKSGARITLDADQYKANREQRLKQMATRLAERVVSAGRSITLEPMPPAERRLIHLALRDHPQVYTESEGEGSQRRVTIRLKK